MDKIILGVTLLSEVLAIIICLHAVFQEKINFDKYTSVVIFISCIILFLTNITQLPQFCVLIVYMLLWIFCYLNFRNSFWITTKKFFVGIFICVLIESVISFLNLLLQHIVDIHILTFASGLVFLVVVCVLGTKITKKGNVLDYKHDKKLQCAIIFYIVIVIAMVVDYIFMKTPLRVSMISVAVCVFVGYLYMLKLIHTKVEVERKNLEIELNRVYGNAYVELSSMVRKRQHDFKNQLGAIYSMHITATSLEELVSMQRQYGDELLDICKYDSILTNCANPILAGYLYHRCLLCENKGIIVDYDIHVEHMECLFSLHELIEVLGILIDNACENFDEFKSDNPVIKLVLRENFDAIKLSIANPSRIMKCSEIEKMFLSDVSTKGKNRGIGLVRLKEIAQIHGTEIKVVNYMEVDCNWLCFEINMRKIKSGKSI